MIRALFFALLLAGCAAQSARPPSEEPGFSRFCAEHPHRGTCP